MRRPLRRSGFRGTTRQVSTSIAGTVTIGGTLTSIAGTGPFTLVRGGVDDGAQVNKTAAQALAYVFVAADIGPTIQWRGLSGTSNAITYAGIDTISTVTALFDASRGLGGPSGSLDLWANEAAAYPWTRRSDPGGSGGGGFTVLRDGNALVEWRGVLYSLFGWSATAAFPAGSSVTNQILAWNPATAVWDEALAHDASSTSRPPPCHPLQGGVIRHVHAGVDYVYVLCGDHYDYTKARKVWRSSHATLQTWEYVGEYGSGNRSLQFGASLNGALYVMGGQTDLSLTATALQTVERSTDGGATWTQLSNAPWAARGMAGITTHAGKIYVAGGGTYDATLGNRLYYNDVYSFDGTTWTQVLANGHGQWTACEYLSLVSDGTRIYALYGFGGGVNLAQAKVSTDNGANWIDAGEFAWGVVPASAATHAVGAAYFGGEVWLMGGIRAVADSVSYQTWSVRPSTGNTAASNVYGVSSNRPMIGTTTGSRPAIVFTQAGFSQLAGTVVANSELRDFIGAATWHVQAVLKVASVATSVAFATSNECLIADTGTLFAIGFRNNAGTYTAQAYHFSGANVQGEATFTPGSTMLLDAWYDGTQINVRINAGAAGTGVGAAISGTRASPCRIGTRYDGTKNMNADLELLLVSSTQLTSAQKADTRAWYAYRYGVTS